MRLSSAEFACYGLVSRGRCVSRVLVRDHGKKGWSAMEPRFSPQVRLEHQNTCEQGQDEVVTWEESRRRKAVQKASSCISVTPRERATNHSEQGASATHWSDDGEADARENCATESVGDIVLQVREALRGGGSEEVENVCFAMVCHREHPGAESREEHGVAGLCRRVETWAAAWLHPPMCAASVTSVTGLMPMRPWEWRCPPPVRGVVMVGS